VSAPQTQTVPPPEAALQPHLSLAPHYAPHSLSSGRVRLVAAADAVAVVLALVVTYLVADTAAPPAMIAPPLAGPVLAVIAAAMWLGVFTAYGLYESQVRAISPTSLDEVPKLFHALLAGSLLMLVAAQILKRVEGWVVFSAAEAALFCGLAIVVVPLGRSAVRSWLLPAVMQRRRALIVGAGAAGELIRTKLERHPEFGLDLVGFVDDAADGPDVLGSTGDLTRLVDELEVDWIVLALSDAPYEEMLELVRRVRRPDVHLSIVPQFFEVFASNATIEDLRGVPIVSLPPMRFSRAVLALKRGFDILASAAGLLLLSPVLAATAIAIKLDSPGPVLFKQLRNGRGGNRFKILKFRTMVEDAESQRFDLAHLNELGDGPLFKIKSDPRITRIGAFLRKYSIDELPQLWNVLRGEMSLVGPRPFVVHEADQITGWAGRRLDTTPGITGLWQVLGRNDIPFDEMVKLDYIYVTNWSLWWDIKILCRTIPVVFGKSGAY
jgi:exopolysaccharide biosynthesis polyprenyl glycosylphosphotransferase